MYGPMRGKIGAFGAAEKNQINRQVQAEIAAAKRPTLAQKTPNTFRVGGKRSAFRDKNAEIKRRQTQQVKQKEWMDNVTNMFGADAKVEKSNGMINVFSGFQNFKYTDDPWGYGDIQLKDVDVFVPEGFKKVKQADGSFKIVGDTKKYTRYYKKKSGGKTKKDYGTYIGTEALLDTEGNLKKVIKRDDYLTYYKKDEDTRKKKYDVYVKEEILFDDDNRKVLKKTWDDFKEKDYDYYTDGKRSGRKDRYSTYLKNIVDFKQGFQQTFSRPGTVKKQKWSSSVQQEPQQDVSNPGVITRTQMDEAGLNTSRFQNVTTGGISDTQAQQSISFAEAQRRQQEAREKAAREKAQREAQRAYTPAPQPQSSMYGQSSQYSYF